MEENTKISGETPKLDYDQLNNAAQQLAQQNLKLRKYVQQLESSNFFARLEYLFKVLENSKMFTKEFVDSCVKEITESMTIPEEVASVETKNE